jgi:hypothetical protein
MKKQTSNEVIPLYQHAHVDIRIGYADDLEISSSGKVKWQVFDYDDKIIRSGFVDSWSSYLIQHLQDSDGTVIRITNMDFQTFDIYVNKFTRIEE